MCVNKLVDDDDDDVMVPSARLSTSTRATAHIGTGRVRAIQMTNRFRVFPITDIICHSSHRSQDTNLPGEGSLN